MPVAKTGAEKCNDGYCEIPSGTFQMGSKTVRMTGFQLGQTEVSVSDYQAYLSKTIGTRLQAVVSGCSSNNASQYLLSSQADEKGPDLFNRAWQIFSSKSCTKIEITKEPPPLPDFPENNKGGNYPVLGLLFDEKRAYCQAQGKDLATAAQLHYASQFDDQDSIQGEKNQRIIWDNGFRSTKPVNGGYKNRFGIYNLLGNATESTLDAYDPTFYDHMVSKDPYNPLNNPYSPITNPNGQVEELSGGSFKSSSSEARSAARTTGYPGDRHLGGFRCARSLLKAKNQDKKK